MKTVRRYFFREIAGSVAFVCAAFLGLFFFIDFVAESGSVGRGTYTLGHAAIYSVLMVPSHLYELAPIAVLIGSIYALARMAQSSEYTIFRTAGLGPRRALRLLTQLGLAFCFITFAVGDWIAPYSTQAALQLQARHKGGRDAGQMGIWLKDRQKSSTGEHTFSVNIGKVLPDGSLSSVKIFEFDEAGRPVRRIESESASIGKTGSWELRSVQLVVWPAYPDQPAHPTQRAGIPPASNGEQPGTSGVTALRLPEWAWKTSLTPSVVAAAVMPHTLTTLDLVRYVRHLAANEQAAQEYEIQFWKRALYPVACLVMMGLALPFAYLHARGGGISLKVFGGIMLGISFVLLNNVASHLGMLRNWTPWVAAATPSLIYMILSMSAFAWLVRYR
jgi:lipopolysaccharide export system permease protein